MPPVHKASAAAGAAVPGLQLWMQQAAIEDEKIQTAQLDSLSWKEMSS